MKRGDVFFANLSGNMGSEQGGVRPVVIIQNNIGNRFSPTVIVASITSQITKKRLPTHVEIKASDYKISRDSVVLLEQIRTIDKSRLTEKIDSLSDIDMEEINKAISISLGIEMVSKFKEKVAS